MTTFFAGEIALRGDMSEVRGVAGEIKRSLEVEGSRAELHRAAAQLHGAGHSRSILRLESGIGPIDRDLQRLVDARDRATSRLSEYAAQVTEVQQRATALQSDRRAVLARADAAEALLHRMASDLSWGATHAAYFEEWAAETRSRARQLESALGEIDSDRKELDVRCSTELARCVAELRLIRARNMPRESVALGAAIPGTLQRRRSSKRSIQAMLLALPPSASVAEVESWWAELSAENKERLVVNEAALIGNLNGVPIEARVRANSHTAAHLALKEGISATEKNYWERAARGEVALVSLDRERYSIVEMLGHPNEQTDFVVTYLPGTATSVDKFFAGGPQAVGRYLAQDRPSSQGVVFVYKDGPWSTWLGERSNRSEEFAQTAGAGVAKFQAEVVDRDPLLAHKTRVGGGHSAGVSILSAAEAAGAEFDMCFSLGGSWLAPGWEPGRATKYHHFQYEQDMINRLDNWAKYQTPHVRSDIYLQHTFPGNGQGELRGHSRIAEDELTNPDPLAALLDAIERNK